MRNYTLIFAVIILALNGCAAFKNVARVVNDVAHDLCMVVAAEQDAEELDGLSPRAWCAIHKNLKPFIDSVLAAKEEAAEKSGFGQ